MDRATEADEILQALAGAGGIAELRVQLAGRTLAIRADPPALAAQPGNLSHGFDRHTGSPECAA